jgi:virginiamycin B lyase
MGVAVDAQGNVWYAEQVGNYIGRFNPQSQTFTTYPLPATNGKNATPQDIVFDAQGRLWFDETVAGRIGRLDPATGAIQTWPLPVGADATPAYPYGMALAVDGSVWYGSLGGGVVGRLDPATGQVTVHHLASAQTSVFSMASDAQGRIWFTELLDDTLGVINTTTGQIAELAVPATLGKPSSLYGVTVTPDGAVWFASAGANALVRYTPTTGAYTFFQLSAPNSVPYGLALDASNSSGGSVHLWFTADGQPNYVGVMNA